MTTKVYIVILNYNCWADTLECLESILRSSYRNYQVIVVDNNSQDLSMDRIRSWAEGKLDLWVSAGSPLRRLSFPPVSRPVKYRFLSREETEEVSALPGGSGLFFIQSGENKGFAAGNNIALRSIIKTDLNSYVWLLNPDMTVEAETLSNLVSLAASCDTSAIFGCHIKYYKHPSRTFFYGGAKLNPYSGTITFIDDLKKINAIDYISGGSLFTRSCNFRDVGLLPEGYFLYWEETDWCTNARLKGLKFEVCDEAVCYDKVSTTIGAGYLSDYYYTLNSLKFFRKYWPKQVKYILCANILRLGKRALKLRFTNVRAILDALVEGFRV